MRIDFVHALTKVYYPRLLKARAISTLNIFPTNAKYSSPLTSTSTFSATYQTSHSGCSVSAYCNAIPIASFKESGSTGSIPQFDGGGDEESIEPRASKSDERVLRKWKQILDNLLEGSYDNIEILALAHSLGIKSDNLGTIDLDLMLKKILLENILKEETGSEHYLNLLRVIDKQIITNRALGYTCCLPGCMFTSERHIIYVRHLRQVHCNYPRLLCQFKHECLREFKDVDSLLSHIKDTHTTSTAITACGSSIGCASMAVKCNMVSCGGKTFENVQLLMRHLNTDHIDEARSCIFKDCCTKFPPNSASRNHFRLKHTKIGKIEVKDTNIVHRVDPQEKVDLSPMNLDNDTPPYLEDTLSENYENAVLNQLEVETPENDNESSLDYFLSAYADFMNRMCNVHFIPYKTMQIIAAESLSQSQKSLEVKEIRLRKALKLHTSMDEDLTNDVINSVLREDGMFSAQKQLNSSYKWSKYITDNFKYTAPREMVLNSDEVKLGKAKDAVHYVPVIETFKQMIEDYTFKKAQETFPSDSKMGVLADVLDGSVYRNNKFFQENPGAFAAIFYSDALEIVNPLGAARGKHKVVQIFYTLANVPKIQRSNIDRMQLALIVKEKVIKKYGLPRVYEALLNDLIILEQGIQVNDPLPRTVKCGVILHAGDNLESHTVGGFSTSFSSRDVCRFCHIQYSDLLNHIHDFDGDSVHKYWSVKEYDDICDRLEKQDNSEVPLEGGFTLDIVEETLLEADEPVFETEEFDDDEITDGIEDVHSSDANTDYEFYGLRHRCPFNALQSFHAVYSFPPDILHDFHEGVIAQDLCGIIKILSRKGWFSIEEYNCALQRHKFKSYESCDVPQLVKPKAFKLIGKAISIWLHLRCFGMVIEQFVQDINDDVLEMAVALARLSEKLSAVEFREHEVDCLEDEILKYLDKRKLVYEQYPDLLGTPKPKVRPIIKY